MHAIETRNDPVIFALWPAAGSRTWLRAMILAVLGSVVLTASAKIQIPFWPVPMTMQSYVVLVIGALYGWRLGGATVLLYLAEGFAGLPVFAGAAAGPAYFAGPTAGYLVGFVAAAMVVGFLVERGWGRSLPLMIVAMAFGHAILFATGVFWLASLLGFERALVAGLYPFWMATLLKTALAGATVPLARRLVRRA